MGIFEKTGVFLPLIFLYAVVSIAISEYFRSEWIATAFFVGSLFYIHWAQEMNYWYRGWLKASRHAPRSP